MTRRRRDDNGVTSSIRVGVHASGEAAPSVSVVAFLGERIAAHVIAAQLPERGLFAPGEPQAVHPFRGLPEMEMRHQQPRGSAVTGRHRRVERMPTAPGPLR
jgi:hypothetical protein